MTKVFGHVHRRTATPLLATLIVALATIGLAFLFPLEKLAEATSLATLTVFTLVNVSLLKIRLGAAPLLPDHLVVPLCVTAVGLVTCMMMASALLN